MLSYMISHEHNVIYDMIYDIRHDIIYKYAFHLLFMPCSRQQRVDETDDDREPDRPMDFDEERDYADQGPLTEMDMDSSSRHGGSHRDSNATVEAHALLRPFGCIEWECEL